MQSNVLDIDHLRASLMFLCFNNNRITTESLWYFLIMLIIFFTYIACLDKLFRNITMSIWVAVLHILYMMG